MIVAEISQNFTNLAEAKELVRLARENDADLAKAQLFDSAKLYKEKSPAELSFEDAKELFEYGQHIGIEVFFSVFDVERVKWCEEIGVKRYKIAYSQRNNTALIDYIISLHLTSQGMDDGKWGRTHFIYLSTDIPENPRMWGKQFLYCVPLYPAELEQLNLRKIGGCFEDWIGFDGFSDHTIGLDAAKIALARGAGIIEKHFSISHDVGIDGKWSMIPAELKELKRWELVCKEAL